MDDEGLEDEERIMDERASARGRRYEESLSVLCHHPAKTVLHTAVVGEVIALLQRENTGALVVVDDAGKLIGIVTERDLLKKVLGRREMEAVPVTKIMTPDPETLQAEDQIVFVMNKMHVGGFRHVPVVDDENRPLHVISIRDVLAYLLEQFASRLHNVPVAPVRGETGRYGG